MSHRRVPFAVGLLAALSLTVAASAGARELPRLHAVADTARGGRIADARGREVLLRGVNVNALGEYWQGTATPPVLPFEAADAQRIRGLGWNVVRLIVSWSRVEPAPGHYDEAYIKTVEATVALLAGQGVYTIVDLHQDAWGATLAARPDEVCHTLSTPALGWDGAPGWATLAGDAARCYVGNRELSPAVQTAWAAFFADRAAADGVGIQTRYVAMLGHLARHLARVGAVAGIDVMNEPGALGATQNAALGPFYARAVRAIRAGERAGGGFRHLVLVEPSVVWSLLGSGPPPRFAHDADLVYAPHLYQGSIGGTSAPQAKSFATARREARGLGGAPVLTGEWGGDPARAKPAPGGDGYFLTHQALQDRFRISATLWTWKQSCGDPHDVLTRREGRASPTPPWSVFAMDCANGANRVVGEHAPLVAQLRRGYVRAAPGRLAATIWTPKTRVLTASGADARATAGPLEAFFPTATPRVRVTGLRAVTRTAVPGGGTLIGAMPTGGRWTLRAAAP